MDLVVKQSTIELVFAVGRKIDENAVLSMNFLIVPIHRSIPISLHKQESTITISPSSYTLILIAIGLTLVLLIVLLLVFIFVIRRKLKSSSSSSSSCSSDSTSFNKHSRRLSIAIASSLKSSASSPVPSTYVDYWSRTIISPSEWTLTKPCSSFIGANQNNNQNPNYYIDQ